MSSSLRLQTETTIVPKEFSLKKSGRGKAVWLKIALASMHLFKFVLNLGILKHSIRSLHLFRKYYLFRNRCNPWCHRIAKDCELSFEYSRYVIHCTIYICILKYIYISISRRFILLHEQKKYSPPNTRPSICYCYKHNKL